MEKVTDNISELRSMEDSFVEEEICPKCFGSGMEVVEGKGARPCDCRKQSVATDPFARAGIPLRYANATLDSYIPITKSLDRALDATKEWVKKYPNVEGGLLFMGSVGTGKTHLAVSILKALIERNVSCLFYDFSKLLREIQRSYNPVSNSSEYKVLAPIFQAEVLVLDEVGLAKTTDWVQDTVSHIINTRYNDEKITIFTTNYLDEQYISDRVSKKYIKENLNKSGLSEIEVRSKIREMDKYSDQDWERLLNQERQRLRSKEETLDERIGIRMRSRLRQMCKTVYVDGPDHRKLFDPTSFL